MIGSLLREIPSLSRAAAGRHLVRRGNAARDAGQYGLAAALYLEALRLNPGNVRVRVQCGHMFKEAGDLAAAEEHYLLASRASPDDADLALQIGHLHKVAGRPEDAQASYRRALELIPRWQEAERELMALGDLGGAGGAAPDHGDWIVPQLLPRGDTAGAPVDRNILRLFRLGGRRAHSRWGDLKVMRGIEAIRGYRLHDAGLTAIRLLIDGQAVRSEPLRAYPRGPDGRSQFKYVFNIWHDFSDVAPGRHEIELAFLDAAGRAVRRHRENVLVAPPLDAAAGSRSDTFVPGPSGNESIEAAINARPSMVRRVDRAILPDPVRAILVQRVDQLGDLVASVPAIRRLRELFGGAHIVGLVTSANAPLAHALDLFDDVVVVPFAASAEERRILPIEAQDALRRTLATYDFDIAVDLGENDESRPLLLLSGARFLYGFKDRASPWLDAGLDFNAYDPLNGLEITPPSRKIALLIEGLGVLADNRAEIVPNADRAGLAAMGIAADARFAVLHAGARLAYSRWPFFAELARILLDRSDLTVILFSDDPEVVAAARAGTPHAARLHAVSGQIPFAQFDALLSHCAVFVGNDSGPKHLAALRGAPVVSLHMARLNWSEWGQEMTGRIISRRVPCAGCGIGTEGEDCGRDFACLRNITVEEVFDTVMELL